MIVAVFSDVHANLPALEAFLAEVHGVADSYVCLGDVVNYGPWNDECLDLILELPDIELLEGNHEQLFLNEDEVEAEMELVQAFYQVSKASFSRFDAIRGLPRTTNLGRFTCAHTIGDDYVFVDSKIAVDRSYLIGHSHRQFAVRRDGWDIVNPGSVGQNRRRIDKADFALYHAETDSVTLHSVDYDVGSFIGELRGRGWPQPCIDYYERKRMQAAGLNEP
jgi:predicted phosphodiesterase